MLARRPTQPKNRWQGKPFASTCALLTTLLFSHASFAADARTDYDLDDDGLIEINDLADLNEIRNNLDGKTLYGSNAGCPDAQDGTVNGGCIGFELTTDLDFDTNQDGVMDGNDDYWNGGYGWSPIGDYSNPFSAVFDGNGFLIRNLFINRKYSGEVGLFSVIESAQVQNFGLTGKLGNIISGGRSGAITGRARDSLIQNVFNTLAITAYSQSNGGIVGHALNTKIYNAFNTGSLSNPETSNSYDYTGGIAGSAWSSSIIENTFSTGVISGRNTTGGVNGDSNPNSIFNTYWATDSSNQGQGQNDSEINSYAGLTLLILRCAIQANTTAGNSDCVSIDGSAEHLSNPVTLYRNWDQAAFNNEPLWHFGTSQQLPGLVLNSVTYRDSDGDGSLDEDDSWPLDPSASYDTDNDGHPDQWSSVCDTQCISDSSLTLDQFPDNSSAWLDADLDGLPDAWANSCDATCQSASGLELDLHLNDTDNDGLSNLDDTDDNEDGLTDVDANSNGLIDINNLEQLNAVRHQLDGSGFRLTADGDLNQSGCPAMIYQGRLQSRCMGYELTSNLDFDTNQDGIMDSNDTYWNENNEGIGEGWSPIGYKNMPFTGTFEGNGHSIHNLYINQISNNKIGLFSHVYQASISNLVLTGALMSVTGSGYVGGLAGYSYSSQINNSMNTGPIKGDDYVGGLVGYSIENMINNSINTGPVKGDGYIGGLIGYIRDSQITNILSTGFVQGNRSHGGLIGGSYNNQIYNSYWATDSSAQTFSHAQLEASSYVGATLSVLQCAVDANTNSTNSNCVSDDGSTEGLNATMTLFNGWGQATDNGQPLWDFGSPTQLPALVLSGTVYRDTDGDGSLDTQDVWPNDPAVSFDYDNDGHPDKWNLGCDKTCIANSGLSLDQFPVNRAAWQDDDLDGLPDGWADSCDTTCQNESGLVLDTNLDDTDNDGLINLDDDDDNDDGIIDVDADSDGLIDIHSLVQLDAVRHQLDGSGLRLTADAELDQSGCPAVLYQGQITLRCVGYELTGNLDFDTNQDGVMDSNDDFWNANSNGLGEGWLPLGNISTNFTAIFEANGHAIRNLYINRSNANYIGLFGYINQAEIRNLVLTGPLMSVTGNYYVGGLIGSSHFSQISNVINTGSIHGTGYYIGGLVGQIISSKISNAMNTGSVQGRYIVGGLAGEIRGEGSQINNTISTGYVSGVSLLGGLSAPQAYFIDTITNSYWAVDGSGQTWSLRPSEANSYVGITLVTLQCATGANTSSTNSNCVSSDGSDEGLKDPVSLFNDWDQAMQDGQALWNFGNAMQLPALVLNGTIYRDSDGDGLLDEDDNLPFDTDNDGITNQQDIYPFIALSNLTDTDNDGAPDTCDVDCLALGMNADTDNDNDGILNIQDAFPLISLEDRLDSDGDGIPNECDEACTTLGMTTDLDDDNDGILDVNDAFPVIVIGELLDTDNDGAPNNCDVDCLALGMTADSDDDNDGVLDTNDAFPLIAIGNLLDTDNDGAPDTCDESCLALGMTADLDDDNDGVLDINDVFPLIAIGNLLDTDNDGAPNTCDVDCLALGMNADLDDDNDGVYDGQDTYPLISLGGRLDTDSDGIPNECDESCLALGMSADLDDDNDGVLDTNDAYPLVAIGELLDTDNDGAPDTCDVDCLALGMTADSDDDNDGVLDINDAFPLIAIGDLLDTDNDGAPDTCEADCLALNMTADLDDDNDGVLDTADAFPLDNTEHSDFDNDGTGDVADLDDDNDGVNDVDDPNLGEDNGKPEIINVPSIDPIAVTTENGDAFELLVNENFLNAFTTVDAVDTEFTYEASLNGDVLAIDENDIMLIPAGRQAVQVVAIDTSGNRSEPVEMVAIVYPQVRFEQATSIIGENSTTNIKVSLTGDAPDYPVVINFAINEQSDVNQADLDAGFDITAQHQVIIKAGDAEASNRDGFIEIDIIDDNESENDELLIVDLLSAKLESETDDAIESLFEIDETNKQHELTVTYENLAPVVNLKLEQNGIEVANVQQDAGMVSITAIVQDGNGNDVHTLTWDLNNLALNAPLGNTLNFSPASLPVSTYEISVIATDNGVGQLSDDAVIRFDVVAPPVEPVDGDSKETEEPKSSGGSGGGAVSLWLMLLLFALVSGVGVRRVNAFS